MKIFEDNGIEVHNGNPSEMIYVIARNKQRFMRWCLDHDLAYNAPNVKFIWNSDQLRGMKDVWFVDLGLGGIGPERVEMFYDILGAMKVVGGFKDLFEEQS